MKATVRVQDLRFGYRLQRPVLRGVTFTLEDGFTVILGANGAGKSTLMALLSGEMVPPRGTVCVGDHDVTDKSQWRSSVGWVPQRNAYDEGQRALDFVSDVGWMRGMHKAESRAEASRILDNLGLGDRKKDKIKNLSGGMQRRVMIAAGMVHSPDVIFLDEPTAGLDPNHRAFVTSTLRDMAGQGTTVLMSTHVAADVDDAHRVLFLDAGKIVSDTDVSDLIEKYGSVDAAFRQLTDSEDMA